jgi:hypothetical protein
MSSGLGELKVKADERVCVPIKDFWGCLGVDDIGTRLSRSKAANDEGPADPKSESVSVRLEENIDASLPGASNFGLGGGSEATAL